MDSRTRPVRIILPIAPRDYRIFFSAVRRLRRIMGRKAPDVLTLIGFNLRARDAAGLADDYLDGIGWPSAAGRVVSLDLRSRAMQRVPRCAKRARLAPAFRPIKSNGPSPDPSCN